MVTIAITPEAFAVIVATLPKGCKAELRPDSNGGYQVTLPNGILDRLESMRGPGQSYSDVILALAAAAENKDTTVELLVATARRRLRSMTVPLKVARRPTSNTVAFAKLMRGGRKHWRGMAGVRG